MANLFKTRQDIQEIGVKTEHKPKKDSKKMGSQKGWQTDGKRIENLMFLSF